MLAIFPSLEVIVKIPQASVAVAIPRAPLISAADGLHPSVVAVPVVNNTGTVVLLIQLTVLDAVAVLPHASLAVNVLVRDKLQALLIMLPSLEVMVIPPQASDELAEPSAALITAADGLQPSVVAVPVADTTRIVPLLVQVTVLAAVDVFPHASVAVNVLV